MKTIVTTILLITSISCSSIPKNNSEYTQYNKDNHINNHYCEDLEGSDYYYEVCLYKKFHNDELVKERLNHENDHDCEENAGTDYYFEVCLLGGFVGNVH